jgi:hypothetical protein
MALVAAFEGKTSHALMLALYRFLPPIDRVLVWALRHQRESGCTSL